MINTRSGREIPPGVRDNSPMRQLQLFTTAELAGMRDRTASRSYSPEGDEFRRIHERHRRWGLARRHAQRLQRAATRPVPPAPAREHGPAYSGDLHDRPQTSGPHPGRTPHHTGTDRPAGPAPYLTGGHTTSADSLPPTSAGGRPVNRAWRQEVPEDRAPRPAAPQDRAPRPAAPQDRAPQDRAGQPAAQEDRQQTPICSRLPQGAHRSLERPVATADARNNSGAVIGARNAPDIALCDGVRHDSRTIPDRCGGGGPRGFRCGQWRPDPTSIGRPSSVDKQPGSALSVVRYLPRTPRSDAEIGRQAGEAGEHADRGPPDHVVGCGPGRATRRGSARWCRAC